VATLRIDDVRMPSGRIERREIVEHPGAAAVVAVSDENEVVLVRQHRKAVESDLLEIPAGTLDPGETALACAHRELAEETGLAAAVMMPLLTFAPSPGLLTEEITIFLARGLRPAVQRVQLEEEGLQVVRVPVEQIPLLVSRGDVRDSKTLIGLMLLSWR
jgi:ADP-ribose pyrophosphatase